MMGLKKKFSYLALVLAWIFAPMLHVAGHLAEAKQQLNVTAAVSGVSHGSQAGQSLFAGQVAVGHDCDECQSLAQAKGLAPLVQTVALAPLGIGAIHAVSQTYPRSIVFLLFDHRGPPVQA